MCLLLRALLCYCIWTSNQLIVFHRALRHSLFTCYDQAQSLHDINIHDPSHLIFFRPILSPLLSTHRVASCGRVLANHNNKQQHWNISCQHHLLPSAIVKSPHQHNHINNTTLPFLHIPLFQNIHIYLIFSKYTFPTLHFLSNTLPPCPCTFQSIVRHPFVAVQH